MSYKLFILIPVHNRQDYTERNLISLRNQSLKSFQTIVVDDGSTDNTTEMIRTKFPEVVLLNGDGKLWWTGSVNLGLRYILETSELDDYVLLLNNDLILPEDYISNLDDLIQKHSNTIIGSAVTQVDQPDIIISGGININWENASWKRINVGESLSSFPLGYHVSVSTQTGRGVLYPVKVFQDIGLFDDVHFLQCGDTDFPVRAKHAGYKLIVAYDIQVQSFPENNTHINHKSFYKLSDLREYFFGMRSNANIAYRYWFARNTHPTLLRGYRFFILDLLRNVVHFARRFRLS